MKIMRKKKSLKYWNSGEKVQYLIVPLINIDIAHIQGVPKKKTKMNPNSTLILHFTYKGILIKQTFLKNKFWPEILQGWWKEHGISGVKIWGFKLEILNILIPSKLIQNLKNYKNYKKRIRLKLILLFIFKKVYSCIHNKGNKFKRTCQWLKRTWKG